MQRITVDEVFDTVVREYDRRRAGHAPTGVSSFAKAAAASRAKSG
jgi:hypothetical protein